MSNQQVARKKKDPLDFYETPPEATHALLRVEAFLGYVLEPACGAGAIARVLGYHSIPVMTNDIHQYGYQLDHQRDFLQHCWPVPNIIMNPPYNQAEKFVRHALSNAHTKVASFMRIGFLESQSRYPMFTREGLAPSRVYVFSNRMNCDPTVKSSQVCYAWYIWDQADIRARQLLGVKSVTTLHWITTLEDL